MLIEWLLDFFEAGFDFVAGFFPESFFDLGSYLAGALGYVGDLNYFLPIAELFAVFVAVVVLFPLFMGTSLLLWLVALLRGGSSRG